MKQREALFRVWHQALGMSSEFKLGEFPEWDDGKKTMPYWASDSTCKKLQYIGLNDSEGKRIFEGDILNMLPDDRRQGWIGYVKYDFAGFIVFLIDDKGGKVMDLTPCSGAKIIGNIFDNPELLEQNGQQQRTATKQRG